MTYTFWDFWRFHSKTGKTHITLNTFASHIILSVSVNNPHWNSMCKKSKCTAAAAVYKPPTSCINQCSSPTAHRWRAHCRKAPPAITLCSWGLWVVLAHLSSPALFLKDTLWDLAVRPCPDRFHRASLAACQQGVALPTAQVSVKCKHTWNRCSDMFILPLLLLWLRTIS